MRGGEEDLTVWYYSTEILEDSTFQMADSKRHKTLTFAELLQSRVEAVDSLLCVGLDPHITVRLNFL